MRYDYVTAHDDVIGFIPVVRRRRMTPYPDEVRLNEPVREFYWPLP